MTQQLLAVHDVAEDRQRISQSHAAALEEARRGAGLALTDCDAPVHVLDLSRVRSASRSVSVSMRDRGHAWLEPTLEAPAFDEETR